MKLSTKEEIKSILTKYPIQIHTEFTQSEDMKYILNNINQDVICIECPDAYMIKSDFIYGIEHFRVSQYKMKGKSDLFLQTEGMKQRRDKMKTDGDFSLAPSVDNIIKSLSRNLANHADSFKLYQDNVMALKEAHGRKYRLVIFIEDATECGYIVKKYDTQPIFSPLILTSVAEEIMQYKDLIWGVIYTWSNSMQQIMSGCTMIDLLSKKNNSELLDEKLYVPFEVGKDVHISKEDNTKDLNHVTINLYDFI